MPQLGDLLADIIVDGLEKETLSYDKLQQMRLLLNSIQQRTDLAAGILTSSTFTDNINARTADISWLDFSGAIRLSYPQQSIANNSWTTLGTATAYPSDSTRHFSLGDDDETVTILGESTGHIFLMCGTVYFASNATGSRGVQQVLTTGGASTMVFENASDDSDHYLSFASMFRTTVNGNTLVFKVYQNSGGALNAIATADLMRVW